MNNNNTYQLVVIKKPLTENAIHWKEAPFMQKDRTLPKCEWELCKVSGWETIGESNPLEQL